MLKNQADVPTYRQRHGSEIAHLTDKVASVTDRMTDLMNDHVLKILKTVRGPLRCAIIP